MTPKNGTQSSQNGSAASVPHRNHKGAGRKPREGGTTRTELRLTQREREVLADLGLGDMTAGLRVLLTNSQQGIRELVAQERGDKPSSRLSGAPASAS